MPDGSPGIGAGNSLILQAEDAVDDTVLPRLVALGGDLEHIFPWSPYDADDMPLRFPAISTCSNRPSSAPTPASSSSTP